MKPESTDGAATGAAVATETEVKYLLWEMNDYGWEAESTKLPDHFYEVYDSTAGTGRMHVVLYHYNSGDDREEKVDIAWVDRAADGILAAGRYEEALHRA